MVRRLPPSIGQPRKATPRRTVAQMSLTCRLRPPHLMRRKSVAMKTRRRPAADILPALQRRSTASAKSPAPTTTTSPPALPPARQLPGYATAPDHGYEADEQEHHGDEAYGAEDYYDEAPSPRRRSGLVLVMAVFGLAVLGTAGAFGYRAMFGGAVLPTLPPIIKASNGPNKIVPSAGDSHANNSSQAGVASTGSTENLVSREEQPVNMDPPKAAPRVVSTIPIITGQGSVSPGVAPPVAPGPVAAAPATNWPPPPSLGGAPPVSVAPPMPTTAPPAQVSSEPKKIHTVTIRADQSGGAEAASTAPARAGRRHTPRRRHPGRTRWQARRRQGAMRRSRSSPAVRLKLRRPRRHGCVWLRARRPPRRRWRAQAP